MADGSAPATTVSPSRISAARTNRVITRAVKISRIDQRRHDGNGHGKLHRHAALHDIFVRFVEYRETANQRTNYADTSDIRIPRAAKKPNCPGRRSDKQHAIDLPPIHRMAVVVIVFVPRMAYRHQFFVFVGMSCSFGLCQLWLGHDRFTFRSNSQLFP
jgi:hypothetical protein